MGRTQTFVNLKTASEICKDFPDKHNPLKNGFKTLKVPSNYFQTESGAFEKLFSSCYFSLLILMMVQMSRIFHNRKTTEKTRRTKRKIAGRFAEHNVTVECSNIIENNENHKKIRKVFKNPQMSQQDHQQALPTADESSCRYK